MKKIYTRPEIDIVSLNSDSSVMLTTSNATITTNKGIYNTVKFGSLK